MDSSFIVYDSITQVKDCKVTSPVVVCGSHGGLAAAIFALKYHVKGVIFNDAGCGKDQAGIAGIFLLEDFGILGACVDTFSSCIGIGLETKEGTISYVNTPAFKVGVKSGMSAQEAANLMVDSISSPNEDKILSLPEEKEIRIKSGKNNRCIITLDSNSMIKKEHGNSIILTGSHGGLVGDLPAVKFPVSAAFYNDAGVGKDNAGISRLDWLQRNGVVGATVSKDSAQIGVGFETYNSGIISYINQLGHDAGLKKGMFAKDGAQMLFENLPDKP